MKRQPRGMSRRNESGFILVTVIWMLAILTVITIGFSYRTTMERRSAWYGMDQAQARNMARGAIQRGIMELRNKYALDTYNDAGWYTSGQGQPYTALNQRWSRRINLLQETNYFTPIKGDQGEDVCTFTITDCASRISLNDAPQELLESIEELDFDLVGSILARRSSVSVEYQPYRFVSVDEVLTLEAAQGLDYAEWTGNEGTVGIQGLFTVWSLPGDGLINVNTAPYEVLKCIPELDDSVLTRIFEFRNGEDGVPYTGDDRGFRSLDSMSRQLEISYEAFDPIRKFCKTDSKLFRITAHATRRRGTINAFCSVIVELQGNSTIIKDWKEGNRAS